MLFFLYTKTQPVTYKIIVCPNTQISGFVNGLWSCVSYSNSL